MAEAEGELFSYRLILAALDFSRDSEEALKVAHALATRSGADLIVCHVIPKPVVVSPLFPHYVAMPDAEAIRQQEEEMLRRLSDFVTQSTGRPEGNFEPVVLFGQPAAEIVRFAEERGVDLIVVASRGLTGLARVVLGSVAESVAKHAHCHVLVTRQRLK